MDLCTRDRHGLGLWTTIGVCGWLFEKARCRAGFVTVSSQQSTRAGWSALSQSVPRRLRARRRGPDALAVEYDGVWHGASLQVGLDRERLNRLHAAGWEVVFVTREQLRDPRRMVCMVRAALQTRHVT
jgi:hypothetical protein